MLTLISDRPLPFQTTLTEALTELSNVDDPRFVLLYASPNDTDRTNYSIYQFGTTNIDLLTMAGVLNCHANTRIVMSNLANPAYDEDEDDC